MRLVASAFRRPRHRLPSQVTFGGPPFRTCTGIRRTYTPDDKTKAGGQDRTRIDINENHEVRNWSKKFGVSAE